MLRSSYSADVIRRYLRHGIQDRAGRWLDRIHTQELTALLPDLTPCEARTLCGLLFAEDRRERTLDELDRATLGSLCTWLADDALTGLLMALRGPRAAKLLSALPPDRRKRIRTLQEAQARAYVSRVRPLLALVEHAPQVLLAGQTVEQALPLALEGLAPDELLPVVDADRTLLGQVRLALLLQAPPTSLVSSLMDPALSGLPATLSAEAALETLRKVGCSSGAVVDDHGRLLGVTRLASLAVLVPGTEPGRLSRAPFRSGWTPRLPWLGLGLLAGSGLLWMVGHFVW